LFFSIDFECLAGYSRKRPWGSSVFAFTLRID
jgi:hypothetical protein